MIIPVPAFVFKMQFWLAVPLVFASWLLLSLLIDRIITSCPLLGVMLCGDQLLIHKKNI